MMELFKGQMHRRSAAQRDTDARVMDVSPRFMFVFHSLIGLVENRALLCGVTS